VPRFVQRLRLIPVAAAAVLAMLCLPACSSDAAKPAARVPQGFMGVLAGTPVGDPDQRKLTDREFNTMDSAGVESVRVPVYWRASQPDGPQTTDFTPYDRMVGTAARHHISVLPVVLATPRWARRTPNNLASPPRRPADYAAFMAQLVDRYGPRGTFWSENPDVPRRPIRQWQLWNEPDHLNNWSQHPYYKPYVALLAAAHKAIRGRDPGAKIVLAGLVGKSWVQLAQIYRAGGRRYFDYIAVHPFTRLLPDVLRILRYNRAVAKRYGDARKPMLVTELTWPSSLGKVKTRHIDLDRSERNQATLLDAAYRAIAARRGKLGIRAVYWSSWLTRDRSRDDVFDYVGLSTLRRNGTVRHKPAFYAYKSVARRLQGGK
jgi:polysaccharide biosynthesis protein PslG